MGLGKIGLPLAVQFAGKGHLVTGADIAPETVAAVNTGRPPFPREAHLAERLAETVAAGRLRATTDTTAAAAGADAVVIVVPLVTDAAGHPDFALLDAATDAVAAGLRPGTLVSYETTLPVGTVRGRFARRLEAGSGLAAGRDFALVFSPERVRTGRVFADLRRYPKLVGGIDGASTRRGAEFYRAVLDFDPRPDLPRGNGVWELSGAEAAEFAKLAETTYRDVNIALVNQFARYADRVGVDLAEVVDACNSQPYSHLHRPGIAVGGHCIPVYPRLYLWNDPGATVVRAAREANELVPAYAVGLLEGAYGPLTGVPVTVLGASYRGGVRETAYSGVFPLVEALRAAGAEVGVSDPLYAPEELAALGLPPDQGKPAAALVVQADHPEYRDLGAVDFPGVRVLLDGRRVTDPARWEGVRRIVLGGGG
ncbi:MULTISPECIES: nucleotide sugar dehydrogenase [Kitasatospora]|uniref:Putative dehydrogenase n=1 Tax=Kitasatospora setae (strain ATCC 33774 / DSM 43861 / JCM 3304 / KCC A-0304 / NBRC 14216 / KM-6054) TaxID=452652 RepID=E4NBN5_KITSK|nr:nucleotide sugar dehydrogenase [Kitasatospora setae]BAJ28616.1 putative dehydrogenase [Kitasatospora setae KM-6054]